MFIELVNKHLIRFYEEISSITVCELLNFSESQYSYQHHHDNNNDGPHRMIVVELERNNACETPISTAPVTVREADLFNARYYILWMLHAKEQKPHFQP